MKVFIDEPMLMNMLHIISNSTVSTLQKDQDVAFFKHSTVHAVRIQYSIFVSQCVCSMSVVAYCKAIL